MAHVGRVAHVIIGQIVPMPHPVIPAQAVHVTVVHVFVTAKWSFARRDALAVEVEGDEEQDKFDGSSSSSSSEDNAPDSEVDYYYVAK